MSAIELPTTIDPAWWQHDGPIEADLGCARGHFLVAAARQCPDRRFLGVEWQMRRARETLRKLQHHNLDNGRVLRGEILETLREHVPEGRLERIHVLFPDPWPKRRHAARRLLQASAWEEFARCLSAGGSVRFLTDDAPYFQQTLAGAQELSGWQIVSTSTEEVEEGWPYTEFQSRFHRLGLPIYGMLVARSPEA